MRKIQDCANGIYPSDEEAKEALAHFKETLPHTDMRIVSGAVGHWVMLQNGATCFYCPPIFL